MAPGAGVGHHAGTAATIDDEIDGEPALQQHGGSGLDGLDEGPLDLDARGRAAGVHDPGRRMAALPGQIQGTAFVPVELGSPGDELEHPARALVDEDAHRPFVAQPGPGGQGVGQVEVGGIGVTAEHGGNAALGPAGGGLVELPLGDHADGQSQVGGPHRGRQAGHPAAHHDEVQMPPSRVHDADPGEAPTLSIRRARPNRQATRSLTSPSTRSGVTNVTGSTTAV